MKGKHQQQKQPDWMRIHSIRTSELYTLLGGICAQFSQLEFFLSVACTKLLGDDANIGFIVTSESSFSRLVALFNSLISYRTQEKEVHDLAGALVKRLTESEQKRNTATHSMWMTQDGEKSPFLRMKMTAKLRSGYRQQWQDTSREDLDSIGKFIADTNVQLMDFDHFLVSKGISQMSKKDWAQLNKHSGGVTRSEE